MEKEAYEIKLIQERERQRSAKEKNLKQGRITEQKYILEEEAERRKKRAIAEEHERLVKLEMEKKEKLKMEQDILDQKQAARLRELEAEKSRLSSELAIQGQQFEGANGRTSELMTDDNSEDNNDQKYFLNERPVPADEIGFNVQKKIKDFETKERKIAKQVERDRHYPKKGGSSKKHPKVQVPGRVRLGY